jgi:hypothetical protein
MKFLNTRFKKTIFWLILTIIVIVALIIIFISPIAKFTIEKYDFKFSGRQVTMDWIYVNPFTGYVHIDDLKIHEQESDSIFFSADGVSANFEMHKLLSKTYEISSLTLDNPVGHIIQNKKDFNFNDLIEKFSPKDKLPKKKKEPVHFNILDIKIVDGTFYYHERNIPVNYFVKKVNIETSGKMWNQDTLAVKFSLMSGIGTGDIKGNTTININSLDYRIKVLINKFDLSVLEQYLKDIANYGSLRANLDADLYATGNFKATEQLNAKGLIAVNDFHFGKSKAEDYASFVKTVVSIKQLSPVNKKYSFDSIAVTKPYFKYERYDHLDNLQNMFGKKGGKVKEAKASHEEVNILFQLADYVKLLAKNFFRSNYKIQRLAIYEADIKYEDYTLNEKFSVSAKPLTIIADSIDRTNKNWVNLRLRSNIKPYGDVALDLSINPQDSSDFNLVYNLDKLPAAMFNPYLITYTSFPLDRGTIQVKGDWKVENGVINSRNHLLVIDPRINKKQKRNGAKWIPLKAIMFLVRERGNVIDYEVPISGNLKDPKFKFKDVILDVVTNIFVKPATTPYRAEVKHIETEIEKSLIVRWDMNRSTLPGSQAEFMEKMVDNLKENPETNITVRPIWYTEKEKEYILFFEAKKLFYQSYSNIGTRELTEADTIVIDKISVKDSSFTRYLDKKVNTNGLYTVQDKCMKLVGKGKVDKKYNKLLSDRYKTFMAYFKEEGLEKRLKMVAKIDKMPYNGFSLYKISYKGEVPEELQEDYERINELNSRAPREKFKKTREKYRKNLRNK